MLAHALDAIHTSASRSGVIVSMDRIVVVPYVTPARGLRRRAPLGGLSCLRRLLLLLLLRGLWWGLVVLAAEL